MLPDDYKYESALYIDGKEVPVDELARLSPEFVRELFVMHQWENMANVDKQAKPYIEWFRADNPLPRFQLSIKTASKRAKRDSSYYAFSPFYTGDF